METKNKIIGIYKLTSPSGKCYIGQSWNIEARLLTYQKIKLGSKVGAGSKIHNAISKYGFELFQKEILLRFDNEVTQKQLDDSEIEMIAKFDSKASGYNIRSGGQFHQLSYDTKRTLSEIGKERLQSQEERNKISDRLRGRRVSKETRDKISNAQKGKIQPPLTDEQRKKLIIANSRLRKPLSDEHKKKISETKKNDVDLYKDFYKERVSKMNEAWSGKKHTPETIEKIAQSKRGKPRSDETKKKLSEALKGRQQSVDIRKKKSETMKETIRKKRLLLQNQGIVSGAVKEGLEKVEEVVAGKDEDKKS